MRTLLIVAGLLLSSLFSFAQKKTKIPAKHYPSLLWEITGKGMAKPSYLFGTMHVSSKMVFHLSDSFYLGLKNADVVALETDMGTWQEDFSRYDLEGQSMYNYSGFGGYSSPSDYLSISTLRIPPYERMIEAALYSSPSMINNFLYRSNPYGSNDFEEDTYLDMHIYQAGKKWGKKVCGVENFDESMQLMKEAYEDAAKEKNKKQRGYDYDNDLSYAKLEEAYRTGNLDLLDTINKVNSTSAAFDEKFMYKRNEIQARNIDSILRTRQRLFVGVGAAHLPGQRGVIEMLRAMGYKLRPIKMTERDSKHKDEVEKIRVPVQFARQTSGDGFFSVNIPGKLYDFDGGYGMASQQQFADMSNGSYYMVTRINTNSLMWGHTEDDVLRKVDSVIYENVPGKILSKQKITKNGYRGFEVTNRTRRGDYQRYNIFVTPFEVVLFKMSGNGDYVKLGTEANQFFSSIQLKDYSTTWKKWSPPFGGFEVELPHQPQFIQTSNWQFLAADKETRTAYEILRTDVHNYEFVEEDSFDLNLMEESFGSAEFIDKQLSRRQTVHGGYPALEAKYRYKDGSTALVKFIIQGTHYYTLVAHGKAENPKMTAFLNSFAIKPFVYGEAKMQTDTSMYFTVKSAVPLEKTKKISMYPENLNRYLEDDDDAALEETMNYKGRLVENDSTGEKIHITFLKPHRYYFDEDSASEKSDTLQFKTDRIDWTYRMRKKYTLPNNMQVLEYVLGEPRSSRYLQGKVFSRDGVSYRLETQGDTLTKQSPFIATFFQTFTPSDTVKGTNVKEKKTALFFNDFFSTDTTLHKRAVKNVNQLWFDSADFGSLRKAIQTLNWNHKKYMDVKKDFVWQLATVKTKESANYLKEIYYAAGDTVDLQYTALEALLSQKNAYAYQVFRDIMTNEPPVLDVEGGNSYGRRGNSYTTVSSRMPYEYGVDYTYGGSGAYYRSGDFLDNLTDSLELTATIFKDLLPLINLNDYEEPMMRLTGTMIDSSMIAAKDYELYLPKFTLEAKQLLKKQVIREKNKSIEKAQKDEEEESRPYYYGDNEDEDYGNNELSLYATLLMPFWDKNPAVPQLFGQLLSSNDKRLKYNTALLMLHHKRAMPDTMLRYFAGLDEYRYELYSDLKQKKLLNRFPEQYNNHIDLAKSRLMSGGVMYSKPDTVVYIDRLPIQHRDSTGFVYFFKYKQSKDDNGWRLASVGMVPSDPKRFEFDFKDKYWDRVQFDFSDAEEEKMDEEIPVAEQLAKALRKMKYSKRNSAREFYSSDRYGNDYAMPMMHDFRD